MKFKCEIDMNNAAFEEDPDGELPRILGEMLSKIKSGFPSGVLMDSNGNKVGKFSITPER